LISYNVALSSIINEFQLEKIFMPDNDNILVYRSDVNRPGLALTGFFTLFEPERIQIIGNTEFAFMDSLDSESRKKHIDDFVSFSPVAIIFTRQLDICEEFIQAAKQYNVPLLRTNMKTSAFMAALIASLSISLAERITRHGVLVEVYGEGVLMLGDSGIGKSETAIELVKRGHRLIADDAVEIKKVSAKTLVGSAPELIRHFAELRGIGIVDIRRIFGMGSVKETEKIDLIVRLEPWDSVKNYDRLGLEEEYFDIMGIKIPMVTIPVRPGRNLAIIIEIAAMNNREKRMGHNSARELNEVMIRRAQAMAGDIDSNK